MPKKTHAKDFIYVFSRIGLITQLGLTLVTPPVLCIIGAVWLQNRTGVGDWVLLAAIVVGIISGGCGMFSLIRAEIARERRRDRECQNKNPMEHGGTDYET